MTREAHTLGLEGTSNSPRHSYCTQEAGSVLLPLITGTVPGFVSASSSGEIPGKEEEDCRGMGPPATTAVPAGGGSISKIISNTP